MNEESLRNAKMRYETWLSHPLDDHTRAYFEAQLLLIERLLEILHAAALPSPRA